MSPSTSLQCSVGALHVLLFGLVIGCTPGADLIDGENILILEGATLIDGTGSAPRPSSVVVLDGSQILRVGAVGDFRYPPDAKIIDVAGRWLLPGFMDLHFHILDPEHPAEVLATLLQFGVTTFRSPATALEIVTQLQGQLSTSELVGPRMFTAGPLVDAPGFLWSGAPYAVEVATTEEVRAEVRRQAEAGVNYVKFYAHLSTEIIRAGIEEAHAAGLKTIGHLGRTGWAEAAAMGIDAVTHFGTGAPTWELVSAEERARFIDFFAPHQKPEFDPTLFGPWRQIVDLDGPEVAAVVSALAANRVEVNATLLILEVMFWGDEPQLLETLEPDYAPASLATAWRGNPHPYTASWLSDALAEAKEVFSLNLALVRRLHEAGVLLTAGSDFPLPWTTPGVSLHREMWLLHQAGIPALEVLSIATRNGAEALGILNEVGTIESGKRADLVILRADPVDDIRNTREIEAVYLGGERVEP
jgi:imidazolonepropionase-like amidohydrolase